MVFICLIDKRQTGHMLKKEVPSHFDAVLIKLTTH